MEIAKQYSPSEIERRVYSAWEATGAFNAEPNPSGPSYCIVIPPPNVTGALHLGHAINNTLQDTLVRYRRMSGDAALWLPGTDHAGIATQAMVEKKLLEDEGKTRNDVGRDALVKRIWDWKEKFGNRIVEQLKLMGCSCDWRRMRFTLDDQCARAVRHTFFRMFKDGLIYRGTRLVNWDAHLQTAVSDDEIYHEAVKGSLWHYWYPVKDSQDRVLVATTRPETMLGDTAVAVHPDDERYKHLIGKTVVLPLTGREIPIIADGELVDPAFGTGCVKVTPAHDPNDYACAQRNDLPMINILNPNGTINANGGAFAGMDRYKARKAVVAELEALGLMEKIEPYETQVGHSDRSKTPIEPYLSDQWFVTMADLAQAAMDAVTDGRVSIHPGRYAKMYIDWLSEKRDWPISRQLWWGHRIPIWYVEGCTEDDLKRAFTGRDDVAWRRDEEHSRWLVCSRTDDLAGTTIPGARIEQDPDVLDTWFSSALWPHSTLGWPEQTPELATWYPTSVLITSRDIITLWVARMVMTGLYNTGAVPFSNVAIHVKILDGQGQTMSKSKGNGVDPADIIEQYGADALRFSLAHMATETQDVRMPVQYKCPHCGECMPQTAKNMTVKTFACTKCKKTMATRWADDETQKANGLALLTSERFELGRNFANKLWNASRFAMMNLEPGVPLLTPEEIRVQGSGEELKGSGVQGSGEEIGVRGPGGGIQISNDDAWILERLAAATVAATNALDAFRFHDYAKCLYDFMWNELCDWYLEAAKPVLQAGQPEEKRRAQTVLACVLGTAVRLLHPVMPFVSEEIWTLLHAQLGLQPDTMLIRAAWPTACRGFCDDARLRLVMDKYELIRAGRNLRSEYSITPSAKVRFAVKPHGAEAAAFLAGEIATLSRFLGAAEVAIDAAFTAAHPMPSQISAGATIFLHLEGALDKKAEVDRLGKQLAEAEKYAVGIAQKLANEKFVENAAPEVVDHEREKLAEAEERVQKLRHMIEFFRA